MRELDRCDFCAERADGVYEVLPPEVDAAERRLVLCADCRDTLAGVVDPLLDALGGRDATETDGDADRSVTLEPPASEAEGRDAAAADADRDGDGGRHRDDGDADDATTETADDADVADDASGDDARDDGDDADDGEATEGARSVVRPEGYRRVVRLLRNRPAAMTRGDLAELASGAYDLDADDVDGIVDAALENGHLEETPEGLRAT
ncbi:hypothetical protein EFA46_003185 [Halarchaeum sp. CBA1220]|uniref:hypothetical protein n=1 Tax=Halarchaeum sp. CBA1220 TaxID=1853682 RepID=UPI000F3AA0C7|nr:hypothetical protein [Halarchaeum sp. CBA1220]QLC33252.1 hypothetical protein EFA46_003185 [Halarchaeum sp. CBA1220]